MVPYHISHIYGIWRSKEVVKAVKSLFGVAMQAIRRDNFFGKVVFSLCITAVLKLYCKVLLGIVNYFIGYYFFPL